MRDRGYARVAVLDIDYHHGNGTQDIFWERDVVLRVPPRRPGHRAPVLPRLGAQALVVSLGVDTFEADPIRSFQLGRQHFPLVGHCLATVGMPTVLVQEGGYAVAEIGDVVADVLGAFP